MQSKVLTNSVNNSATNPFNSVFSPQLSSGNQDAINQMYRINQMNNANQMNQIKQNNIHKQSNQMNNNNLNNGNMYNMPSFYNSNFEMHSKNYNNMYYNNPNMHSMNYYNPQMQMQMYNNYMNPNQAYQSYMSQSMTPNFQINSNVNPNMNPHINLMMNNMTYQQQQYAMNTNQIPNQYNQMYNQNNMPSNLANQQSQLSIHSVGNGNYGNPFLSNLYGNNNQSNSHLSFLSNINNSNLSNSINKNNFHIKRDISRKEYSIKKEKITHVEPQSCVECEEIYKVTIINELPLQVMRCMNCDNVLNYNSLDYYKKKYNKIEKPTKNENFNSKKRNHNRDSSNDNKFSNINQSESEEEKHIQKYKKNDNYAKNVINTQYESEEEIPKYQEKNKKYQSNKEKKHNGIPVQTITSEMKSETFVPSMKEWDEDILESDNINFKTQTQTIILRDDKDMYSEEKLHNDNGGISLAELFRKRKAELMSKIDDRKKSTDVLLSEASTSRIKTKKSLTAQSITTNNSGKLRREESYNSYQNKISPQFNDKSIKKFNEPPPELLDRLINGKRAKVK